MGFNSAFKGLMVIIVLNSSLLKAILQISTKHSHRIRHILLFYTVPMYFNTFYPTTWKFQRFVVLLAAFEVLFNEVVNCEDYKE